MTSYKALIAQEILRSRLIESRFQILYPGAVSLTPGRPMTWEEIFGPDDAIIHAFEADKDDYGRSVEAQNHPYRYYDDVLWSDDGEVTLFVNATLGASSLFPHNFATVDRWGDIGLGADIREVRLKATTVAQWAEREGVDDLDFARLNVEGAELAILKGMGPLLDRIVAVVVETNFAPDYLIGAPVFADIDIYLRQRGFTFFSFLDSALYLTRKASPLTEQQRAAYFPSAVKGRQVLQDHLLYLRDPIIAAASPGAQKWTLDKALKLAFWADVNGQTDFAFEVLAWFRDTVTEQTTKTAIQRVIDAAVARFEDAKKDDTLGPQGEILRLQAIEKRLTMELGSKLLVIEAQAAQIERMHAAYAQLLRANLELSGIPSDEHS